MGNITEYYITSHTHQNTHTPNVSAAIITPPLNVMPSTEVPVTIGRLHRKCTNVQIKQHSEFH